MTLTGKELVKKACKEGWKIERIHSSHYILVRGSETVIVPVHVGKSLGKGLLNDSLKKLGLK